MDFDLDKLERESRRQLEKVWSLIDQAEAQTPGEAKASLSEAQRLLDSGVEVAGTAFAAGYICSALR